MTAVGASQHRLVALMRERFGDRKIVVVSNREPIVHRRDPGGGVTMLHPASGMTTALVPLVAATGGVWVAHGSGTADFDVTDARDGLECPPEKPAYRLRRVRIPTEVEAGYYYGLANEGIWPLCHIAYTAPFFRHSDWADYVAANELFAAAVLDEVGDDRALVFVQDYHLALLPRMLRVARPDLLIAHFWHIPWPNREVMRVMPWLDEFLDGLLGSDLLGFHVQHHCNNFMDTIDRSIEALVDVEHGRAVRGDHPTFVRPFPISIDAHAYAELAAAASFESFFPELAGQVDGQIVLLGVDRLDYTKGIPHRLRMLESLMERHPELVGRVTLVQVGAPTRSAITRYADFAREIAELAEDINRRFGRGEWLPVRYVPEHQDRDALAPLFRRADACLVTSLHDGMNLVAKEYVAAHAGSPGTLLLSKFTGAARELHEACLVNPYDVEGSADVLAASLRLPDHVRADAMQRLWERVCSHDVYAWATELLRSLDDVARRREARTFPGN
jgi:trehalose 6-phosphate synthase/phosphatase